LFIVFASDRPGGLGGVDLWECKRRDVDEPFGEAVNLGLSVNSENSELPGALSGDGLSLLVMRFFRKQINGTSEWCSTERTSIEQPFGALKRFEFPGFAGEQNVSGAHFSSNGRLLVFGRYSPDQRVQDSWFGFSPPDDLKISRFILPTMTTMTSDARTLFFTRGAAGNSETQDLWTSHRVSTDEPFSSVRKLGSPLNSDSTDGAPWISGDGMTLYFTSARSGSGDIWMSRRLPDAPPADPE
jgi:hypothetical protein